MKKEAIFLFFSVVLFGAAFFASFQGGTSSPVLPSLEQTALSQAAEQDEELLPVVLEVEGKTYELAVPPESTAYDLMVKAEKETDFRFSGKEFWGLGFYVEEINGVKENHAHGPNWIYYVNGVEAPVGVSSYILQPNDVVTWRYEEMEMGR